MAYFLSKSDYKVAHSCPTKLYYKKRHYPNLNEQNEYLQHLARGGYMVGKLATLLYPDGIEIDTGSDHIGAIKKTKELLLSENVTLFEAAIESEGKIIRVDILEKKDNVINLIEVKSKSFETTVDEKKIKKLNKDLEDYILDVTFQYIVIKEAYPEWEVKPFLFLPDKSKNTQMEGLASQFKIEEAIDSSTRFRKYDVTYEGNLDELLNDDLLTLVDVEARVLELQHEVREEVEILLESLNGELKKIQTSISKDCFKCEFNIEDEGHPISGFNECWKDLPKVKHHIRDLYYIGSIGGYKNPIANVLITEKSISLTEFPLEKLGNGKRAQRQNIQIKHTLDNTEWIDDNLNEEIRMWEYPLNFIDFETTMTALPFHKGMRPYEVINFQWSCHTIDKPGSEPKHQEWINLESSFPSFKFAEALMQAIGTQGSTLIWSSYENTMLKTIYEQYDKYNYENSELKEWLEFMIKFDKKDKEGFIDMNKIAVQSYFHPAMKGKTSIKWTLPAVLKANKSKFVEDYLANFEPNLSLLKKNEHGEIVNPYNLLPSFEIYDTAEKINDGTGAMRAYEDIMFGLRKGKQIELEKYRKALLRYCKLDTLAMVIIWQHWKD
jgi:uncharacterized protein DUF2779